jgi:hypothetical protein
VVELDSDIFNQTAKKGELTMRRAYISGLLACIAALAGATQVFSQPVCKPVLAFDNVQFSGMQPPTLQRKWTAVVSVDATGCAADATGYFEVVFSGLKEVGPTIEFRERFKWAAPSVKVATLFGADEAVERYGIDNITVCPCAH